MSSQHDEQPTPSATLWMVDPCGRPTDRALVGQPAMFRVYCPGAERPPPGPCALLELRVCPPDRSDPAPELTGTTASFALPDTNWEEVGLFLDRVSWPPGSYRADALLSDLRTDSESSTPLVLGSFHFQVVAAPPKEEREGPSIQLPDAPRGSDGHPRWTIGAPARVRLVASDAGSLEGSRLLFKLPDGRPLAFSSGLPDLRVVNLIWGGPPLGPGSYLLALQGPAGHRAGIGRADGSARVVVVRDDGQVRGAEPDGTVGLVEAEWETPPPREISSARGPGLRAFQEKLNAIRRARPLAPPEDRGQEPAPGSPVLGLRVHVKNRGWLDAVTDGGPAGDPGGGLRIEALQLMTGLDLPIQVYVPGPGWMEPVPPGSMAGTTGLRLPVEAVRVPEAARASVEYRACRIDGGWTGWATVGQTAGGPGEGALDALQIRLLPDADVSARSVG